MKVAVIAAHPDDEVLGCGGAILKHKANGDDVAWIIITNVIEGKSYSTETIRSRQLEIQEVKAKMGIDEVYMLNYPTMELTSDSLLTMVPQISKIFNAFNPEIIYTLNRSDAHSDHRIVFDAVMACTKSFRYPFINQVLMYECISETEFAPALAEKAFVPNYFIDISTFMDQKMEIMKIYKSELGDHPFPRSERNIRALATFRGAQCGVDSAEAFMILKQIWK